MAQREIWCVAIDQENKLVGEHFSVSMSSGTNIAALKDEINDINFPDLSIASHTIVVWQLKQPWPLDDINGFYKDMRGETTDGRCDIENSTTSCWI